MIRIAILDDSDTDRKLMEYVTKRYFAGRGVPCDVRSFSRWQTLFAELSEETYYDIFLLDMELPEKTGLQVAKEIRRHYVPLGEKVRQLEEKGALDRNKAWELIGEYVDLILSIVANMEDPDTLSLLFHEQNQRLFSDFPITRVICKEAERILQTLLLAFWEGGDAQTGAAVSRVINGSLITLGEHPMFIRRSLGLEDDAVLSEDVIAIIRSYTLSSIRSYRPDAAAAFTPLP